MNHKAVYRTAPATPGLLISGKYSSITMDCYIKLKFGTSLMSGKERSQQFCDDPNIVG